jgi:hypothetical protein
MDLVQLIVLLIVAGAALWAFKTYVAHFSNTEETWT